MFGNATSNAISRGEFAASHVDKVTDLLDGLENPKFVKLCTEHVIEGNCGPEEIVWNGLMTTVLVTLSNVAVPSTRLGCWPVYWHSTFRVKLKDLKTTPVRDIVLIGPPL